MYEYIILLGTTICGNDSINFTALQTSTNDNVHACLQASGELDVGRLANLHCIFVT